MAEQNRERALAGGGPLSLSLSLSFSLFLLLSLSLFIFLSLPLSLSYISTSGGGLGSTICSTIWEVPAHDRAAIHGFPQNRGRGSMLLPAPGSWDRLVSQSSAFSFGIPRKRML